MTSKGTPPVSGFAENEATGIGRPVTKTEAVPTHPFSSVPVTV